MTFIPETLLGRIQFEYDNLLSRFIVNDLAIKNTYPNFENNFFLFLFSFQSYMFLNKNPLNEYSWYSLTFLLCQKRIFSSKNKFRIRKSPESMEVIFFIFLAI